jgi:hypothetical protein
VAILAQQPPPHDIARDTVLDDVAAQHAAAVPDVDVDAAVADGLAGVDQTDEPDEVQAAFGGEWQSALKFERRCV